MVPFILPGSQLPSPFLIPITDATPIHLVEQKVVSTLNALMCEIGPGKYVPQKLPRACLCSYISVLCAQCP